MTEVELLAFFKALADPSRLRLVGLLARAPAHVEDLACQRGRGVGTGTAVVRS